MTKDSTCPEPARLDGPAPDCAVADGRNPCVQWATPLFSGQADGEVAAVNAARDITRRRRRPVQKRSRETFDNICWAASEILTEDGLDALNTNAVAERAGVSITAVYAYFPDKFAILHELFQRSNERWRKAVLPLLETLSDNEDYIAVIHDVMLDSAKIRVEDPEYRALLAAIWAVPELADMRRTSLERSANTLATEIRRRNPALTPRRSQRAAQTMVLAVAAVIDECVHAGKVDRPLLDQLSLMVELYLRTVLAA